MILPLLSLVLSVLYSFVIFYIYRGWAKTERKVAPSKITKPIGLSVIIPARDEASNIKFCIDSVKSCTYSREFMEIIVVDDHSNDETKQIVSDDTNILVVTNAGTGKKDAIKTGIAKSKFDIIVTLDADCIVDKHWLSEIGACFESLNPDFICCPVKINPVHNAFEALEFFDTAAMMAVTANGIYRNHYFLANGANFAYKKTSFEIIGGFDGNEQFASGDDVFLVNKAVRSGLPVVFLKSPYVTVITSPQKTFAALLQQRKRWATKTRSYGQIKMLLIQALVFLMATFIPLCLIFVVFTPGSALWALTIGLLVKSITDFFFLRKMSSFLETKRP